MSTFNHLVHVLTVACERAGARRGAAVIRAGNPRNPKGTASLMIRPGTEEVYCQGVGGTVETLRQAAEKSVVMFLRLAKKGYTEVDPKTGKVTARKSIPYGRPSDEEISSGKKILNAVIDENGGTEAFSAGCVAFIREAAAQRQAWRKVSICNRAGKPIFSHNLLSSKYGTKGGERDAEGLMLFQSELEKGFGKGVMTVRDFEEPAKATPIETVTETQADLKKVVNL